MEKTKKIEVLRGAIDYFEREQAKTQEGYDFDENYELSDEELDRHYELEIAINLVSEYINKVEY